jgi:hypothetical protein
MYRIIDKRASGKTCRLFLLAKENNGVVVCADPNAMRQRAYAYGITGIDFISYKDLRTYGYEKEQKPIFIDELELFVKHVAGLTNIAGYTLSMED